MTDIVERIKDAENATHALFNHIFQDAREEIERLRIENEALRAEVIHIKEVEFPRKARAVADGWRGKCERLEAKIEAMEKQEPVAWMLNCQTLGGDTGWILSWTQSGAGLCNRLSGEENEKKLYVLPGAKGE